MRMPISVLLLLLCCQLRTILGFVVVHTNNPNVLLRSRSLTTTTTKTRLFETVNQSKDALRTMVDFHDGTWTGTATSFSVSSDLSAGIRARKVSPVYKSTMKIGLNLQQNNQDYTMTETLEWEDKMKRRQLSLIDSSADIDTVDGSYSLDTTLPDFPSDLIGTIKLLQFGIEHCIAVNDHARIRAFFFYGIDQSLARIVVCQEERVAEAARNPLSGGAPAEESSSSSSSSPQEFLEANTKLVPFPMNLLELTSGVWLGNMILREPTSYQEPKGFGRDTSRSSSSSSLKKSKKQFAHWAMGVQKLAHQWNWDFEDAIQKTISVGKPLGIGLPKEMSLSVSGMVCENESLSTRIPKDQRMVYLDWMGGDQVGIILNNVALQIPRYMSFEQAGVQNRRTFFTECTVFQAEQKGIVDVTESSVAGKLDLVASVSARAYSSDGQLKQASTGFFEFKRMTSSSSSSNSNDEEE